EKVSSGNLLCRMAAFAEPREIKRAAEGETIIVIAERRPLGFAVCLATEGWKWSGCGRGEPIRNEIIGIQFIITHELVTRAVKFLAPAAGDDIDLSPATTA